MKNYILTHGTCKCGLPFPLRVELFFNFSTEVSGASDWNQISRSHRCTLWIQRVLCTKSTFYSITIVIKHRILSFALTNRFQLCHWKLPLIVLNLIRLASIENECRRVDSSSNIISKQQHQNKQVSHIVPQTNKTHLVSFSFCVVRHIRIIPVRNTFRNFLHAWWIVWVLLRCCRLPCGLTVVVSVFAFTATRENERRMTTNDGIFSTHQKRDEPASWFRSQMNSRASSRTNSYKLFTVEDFCWGWRDEIFNFL